MGKTLIDKHRYVERWSNPAKYKLTQAGMECGMELVAKLEAQGSDREAFNAQDCGAWARSSDEPANPAAPAAPSTAPSSAPRVTASSPSVPSVSGGSEAAVPGVGCVVTLCGLSSDWTFLNDRHATINRVADDRGRWGVELQDFFPEQPDLKHLEIKAANFRLVARKALTDAEKRVMECLGGVCKEQDVIAALSQHGSEEAAVNALVNALMDGQITTGALADIQTNVARDGLSDRVQQHNSGAPAAACEAQCDHTRHQGGAAGAFEVVLVVDSRERSKSKGASGSTENLFEQKLQEAKVACQVRELPVGDCVWVGRRRAEPHDEYMLGHVVERKEVSDLASSIIGKRYEEQKYHMQCSGLPHLTYLMEGDPASLDGSLKGTSLVRALHDTHTEGFNTIRTKSLLDTLLTYKALTAQLSAVHENDSTALWESRERFGDWIARMKRQRKVTAGVVWERMLHAIPRIGSTVASAVSRSFGVPVALRQGIQAQGIKETLLQVQRESALSNRQWTSAVRERLTNVFTQCPADHHAHCPATMESGV